MTSTLLSNSDSSLKDNLVRTQSFPISFKSALKIQPHLTNFCSPKCPLPLHWLVCQLEIEIEAKLSVLLFVIRHLARQAWEDLQHNTNNTETADLTVCLQEGNKPINIFIVYHHIIYQHFRWRGCLFTASLQPCSFRKYLLITRLGQILVLQVRP